MRCIYTDAEFVALRREMDGLRSGGILMIVERDLQPPQLHEIDTDPRFVVICGHENNDATRFYCIARKEDCDLAINQTIALIKAIGGSNIVQSQFS